MILDIVVGEPHFWDHLEPIWWALEEDERGDVFVPSRSMRLLLARRGVPSLAQKPTPSDRLTLVAAVGDLFVTRRVKRPTVITEHGAGQCYIDSTSRRRKPVRTNSFLNAADRVGAVAVFAPGPVSLAEHAAAHPDIPGYAIGCPKLDRWHPPAPHEVSDPPVVAVSFHWESPIRMCPEVRSGAAHFLGIVPALKGAGYRVLGHGHPRIIEDLAPYYERWGVRIEPSLDRVFDTADVFVADNTSALFEFASLDRPVVVLNAPWYRRDVEHGMRFWEFADLGVQVDQVDEIVPAVAQALEDAPALAQRRREIIEQVYAVTDGTAAQRAVSALREVALVV